MKYCSKCGKEIVDDAVICVHCGCQVKDTSTPSVQQVAQSDESNGLAIGALVCAFLIPLVGLILGIVGLSKYKTPSYRSQCTTAIILSIVVWIVSAIILSSLEAALFY